MTMKLSRAVAAAAILGLSFQASADTYEFDTVTEFKAGSPNNVITGILRNTTTYASTAFTMSTSYSTVACIPIFLTMMEKPGRYYLTLNVDNYGTYQSLASCALTLRN